MCNNNIFCNIHDFYAFNKKFKIKLKLNIIEI